MLSDHEIARQANPAPLADDAREMGVDERHLIPYGTDLAKVRIDALAEPRKRDKPPRLVLVSATTPTAVKRTSLAKTSP